MFPPIRTIEDSSSNVVDQVAALYSRIISLFVFNRHIFAVLDGSMAGQAQEALARAQDVDTDGDAGSLTADDVSSLVVVAGSSTKTDSQGSHEDSFTRQEAVGDINSPPTPSANKGSRRPPGDGDASDALADWDPFFESED